MAPQTAYYATIALVLLSLACGGLGGKVDLNGTLEFTLTHSQAETEEEFGIKLPLEISGKNYTAERLQHFFNITTTASPSQALPIANVSGSNPVQVRSKAGWLIPAIQAIVLICSNVDCLAIFEKEGNWKGSYGIDGHTYPQGVPWSSIYGFRRSKRSVQAAFIYRTNWFGNRCAQAKWWVEWSYGGQIHGQRGALMAGIDIRVEKSQAWPCWVDAERWSVSEPRNEGSEYWPIAAVDVYHEVEFSGGGRYGCTMTIRGDGSAYQPGHGLCWERWVGADAALAITSRNSGPVGGNDNDGCLGGSSLVELASGDSKPARELEPGNMMLGEGGLIEPLLALPALPASAKGVLRITTAQGQMLELTGSHLLPVPGRGLVEAARLTVGDSLLTAAGPNATAIVAEISTRATTDLVLPLTPSCTLLVDGVVVSCASSETLSPSQIRAFLKPLFVLHSVLPAPLYRGLHDVIFVRIYPVAAALRRVDITVDNFSSAITAIVTLAALCLVRVALMKPRTKTVAAENHK